ncbi:hypothetical protein ATY35_20450 [Vibrio cidicii]|uniref:Uncharacterized protein n=1 Tax=Vibrio cidicii TaxID=1763883 RepID=A0ABR5VW50_9VIBR|nr:hypothetical protein [Vibrio cidicii]KYN79435.1 hypothetical protein ATY35_20450 [Vibrio cidicii]
MVIAEFSFIHHGYSGSLSVSDPNLVRRIQEDIIQGRRQELFLMLVVLLLGESARRSVSEKAGSTLMELKELYELGDCSVTLSNGVKLRIV